VTLADSFKTRRHAAHSFQLGPDLAEAIRRPINSEGNR